MSGGRRQLGLPGVEQGAVVPLREPELLAPQLAWPPPSSGLERDTTARVLKAVQTDGLAAALRFTHQFDGVALAPETVRVPRAVMRHAWLKLQSEHPGLGERVALAVERSRQQVESFARHQSRAPSERWTPLPTAGVVLRRRGPELLRLMVEVTRARAAGVKQVVGLASPSAAPTLPGGLGIPVEALAAAGMLGLDELWALGGAQGTAFLHGEFPGLPLLGAAGRFGTEARRQLGRALELRESMPLGLLVALPDTDLAPLVPWMERCGRLVVALVGSARVASAWGQAFDTATVALGPRVALKGHGTLEQARALTVALQPTLLLDATGAALLEGLAPLHVTGPALAAPPPPLLDPDPRRFQRRTLHLDRPEGP